MNPPRLRRTSFVHPSTESKGGDDYNGMRSKYIYGSVRLMLRPTGQSDKIQSIKSNQYIGYIGSIGSIGYIGSIVRTGNIPPVK